MNDAAVREIWDRLATLEREVEDVNEALYKIDARIRARLKKEADAREATLAASLGKERV